LGTTRFTIDVSVPGMLTAVVLHPPRFGSRVASLDDRAALAEPGVTAVVPIDEGVAVVGDTLADAQRGLRALAVERADSGAERDPTAEAAQVARALDWKHPVKVQSLREEDFKAGRYRAMAVHRVRAAADSDGRLTAFHQQIVAEPTSVNLPVVRDVMFTNGIDFFTTTGAADPPYAFENFKLE